MRAPLIAALAFAGAISMNPIRLPAQEGSKPAADSTKVKKPTADQAKNNAADREMMQKIRKAVMDDKSLSTSAHNVKIIAQNGKITLKGPVRSEAEKKTVEQMAVDVAGSGNVVDDITIKPAKKTSSTR